MKKKFNSLLSIILSIILCTTVFEMNMINTAEAATETESIGEGEYEMIYNNDRVIVSLGDSYSSGEGIEPFYDDIPGGLLPDAVALENGDIIRSLNGKRVMDLVYSKDWLCHRSKNAWSGMLTLEDYATGQTILMNKKRGTESKAGNWYFAAMSGAVTGNILDTDTVPNEVKDKAKKGTEIPKEYEHRFKLFNKNVATRIITNQTAEYGESNIPINIQHREYVEIEPQLNVFNELNGKKAEYVTITMGGNDIKFAGIVTYAVEDRNIFEYIPCDSLQRLLERIENELFDITFERLEQVYKKISEIAGSQAHIIVAGYPRLISLKANSFAFSHLDAKLLNNLVIDFNVKIHELVKKCQEEGMNISFVPVYSAFGDNVAYSSKNKDEELINRLMAKHPSDIDDSLFPPTSAYSIHPNLKGAKVYAECVQEEIDNNEKKLTVTGKATDMDGNALKNVKVTVKSPDESLIDTVTTSADGDYFYQSYWAWDAWKGQKYQITFEKDGYEPFTVMTTTDKTKGNNITVNVKLVPKLFAVNISGMVTDEKGNPVDGAEIKITGGCKRIKETKTVIAHGVKKQEDFWKIDRTQKDTQTVYTKNGKYTAQFVNYQSDDYSITVEKEDYQTYSDTIRINKNKEGTDVFHDYNITLKDGGMYKAYCEVVKNLIDKCGEGRYSNSTYTNYLTGLSVVRLIDFDGDGQEELLCAYSSGNTTYSNIQEIFCYKNGKAVSIYKGQVSSNRGGVAAPCIEYMICDDHVYFLTESQCGPVYEGKWRDIDGIHNNVVYSFFQNYKEVYNINGQKTTQSGFEAAEKQFYQSGQTYTIQLYTTSTDISTQYYEVGDRVLEETQKTLEKIGYKNDAEWKTAYIKFVESLSTAINSDSNWVEYSLINIDEDDIPELWIIMPYGISGGVLCTYHEGKVIQMEISVYGFSYLERENLFANNYLKQGRYSHAIYTINNGEFLMLHSGRYCEEKNTYIPYTWDDKVLKSKEEYNSNLNKSFDFQRSITPNGKSIKSCDDITQAILNYK